MTILLIQLFVKTNVLVKLHHFELNRKNVNSFMNTKGFSRTRRVSFICRYSFIFSQLMDVARDDLNHPSFRDLFVWLNFFDCYSHYLDRLEVCTS